MKIIIASSDLAMYVWYIDEEVFDSRLIRFNLSRVSLIANQKTNKVCTYCMYVHIITYVQIVACVLRARRF